MREVAVPVAPVDAAGPLRPLVNATIVAALVYTFDAWVIGQGGITAIAAMLGVVVAVLHAVNAAVRKKGAGVAVQLAVIAMWVATAGAAIGSIRYQADRAQVRAESVVAACKAYKAANGTYPETLGALVPQYLPSVPRARYTLAMGEFTYHRSPRGGDTTMLMYTVVAPFMRTSYNFESDRWVTLD